MANVIRYGQLKRVNLNAVPSIQGAGGRALGTAGCHLALVRRVFERRPDIQLITFDRAKYLYWLGVRADSEEMRAALVASRV
jgi:hypothetical protein